MTENRVTGFPKYLAFFNNRLLETAVWTFAELGIADLFAAVDRPQTAAEIAEKQGWNSEYLYRLLRIVADADIVREIKSTETIQLEKTNRFELTEDGRYLTSNHPSKCRYLLCWELSPFVKTISHNLPELIRQGPKKNTTDDNSSEDTALFSVFEKEENRTIAHYFNEAMTSYSTYSGKPIVNAVDFSRFNTIVDVGGGLGALIAHILEKYPTIKQGISFDLPNVIQRSKSGNECEKRNIPKDRYQYIGGDMFDWKTIPKADAYTLQNVIHDWDDNQSINILKSIRAAATANQQQITIFIIGAIILSDNEQNKFHNRTTHAFDLHMMIAANAKERTQEQYEYLFEQSGFKFVRLYQTDIPFSIIEAISV